MAALLLPASPAPNRMSIGHISTANVLESAVGADEQEIRRMGSRYALTFSLPPMPFTRAMAWGDLKAEGATVVMKVRQPGFDTGSPGTPRVNGAGQQGATLIVDGLTNGYVIRKDQFLSVITAGRRRLYRAAADVTVASGQAAIPLRTLLRYPPSDNDVIEIAQPMIEGWARDVSEVEVGPDRLVSISFTVRER